MEKIKVKIAKINDEIVKLMSYPRSKEVDDKLSELKRERQELERALKRRRQDEKNDKNIEKKMVKTAVKAAKVLSGREMF